MEAVYQRHQQYPFVYEELSMVLVDRQGKKETRKLRRYSRLTEKGRINLLLLFDSPADVKGVAILASREPSGEMIQSVYLPAFGRTMIHSGAEAGRGTGSRDENFLGTDYSIENLTGEVLKDYQYIRRQDLVVDDVAHYIIDVYLRDETVTNSTPPLRRHYVIQDNLYITRTDYLDELGRLKKKQTHHDLNPVHGDMWRSNMMLMDNQIEDHRTIIKIDKRVFSSDYVPAEVFTEEWLFENQPPLPLADEVEVAIDAEDEGSKI